MKPKIARAFAWLFLLACSALCICAADEPTEEKPFIKLQLGAADEIRADGAKATARFPMVLQGVKPESLKLRIMDVVLG
ncbi:MAG: hypothetical protein HOP19_00855, partial [Acidobacteria bacterium]|nr:hypothetical protein [Acidobacteriota bacterium]